MKRINIMCLTYSLDVGGTENHIFNFISNLNKDRFTAVVCCLYNLGSIGERLLNSREDVKIYHSILKNRWDLFGVWKLLDIFKNENIDILYTVNAPLTIFWGTICAKLTRVEVSITRFTTTFPTYHVKRWKIINYLMLVFVDKIIAQSFSHKKYLIEHEGVESEKIAVICNGVELKRFNNAVDGLTLRHSLGVPQNVPVIGIVARLSPEKELNIFLRAAGKIISVLPYAHFLIVGDGGERKKLEMIAHELTIPLNVHFLGTRVDIPEIVSLFDVGVLTSNRESFPNVILEYMAASKPVVATNVGSISELVIDEKTGYLISCGDVEALVNAILKLLKDSHLAKKMGQAGRKRVEEEFTIQKMVARYETVFDELLK